MVYAVRWSARIERAKDIGRSSMQRSDEITMAARTVRGRLHAEDVDGELVVAGWQPDRAIRRSAKRRGDIRGGARSKRCSGQVGGWVGIGRRQHDRQLVADGLAEL